MQNKQYDINKDRFAVIGVGDTGTSIINFLNVKKANLVRVFDTRVNPPNVKIDYKIYCGALDFNLFEDIDVVIISPGVSIFEPVLQQLIINNKKVIGDVELFADMIRDFPSKIIAITGSNGKTTVTTLVTELLKSLDLHVVVSGNIGIPVLQSYLEIEASGIKPDFIVLELSSFQLETITSLSIDAATVLNISEDHLDRYRDLLEYAYIKANIFNNCKFQIINIDDFFVHAMQRKNLKKYFFSEKFNDNFYIHTDNDKDYLYFKDKQLIDCTNLKLIGRHNYLNILASLALLHAVDVDITNDNLLKALSEFQGLEHRMQLVTKFNEITFIEDSKGTNIGAVIAGISGLSNKVNLILGGDGKGQDFSLLVDLVAKKCNSVAIIGQDKDKIYSFLKELNIPIKLCNSLDEAVFFCYSNATINQYVILSPACASWDMFQNYKHRAQEFVRIVNELKLLNQQ